MVPAECAVRAYEFNRNKVAAMEPRIHSTGHAKERFKLDSDGPGKHLVVPLSHGIHRALWCAAC